MADEERQRTVPCTKKMPAACSCKRLRLRGRKEAQQNRCRAGMARPHLQTRWLRGGLLVRRKAGRWRGSTRAPTCPAPG